MSEKKTKIGCKLSTLATDEAKAKVIKDLGVPDPEPEVSEQLINDAINGKENDITHDDQQENS